MRLGYWNIRGVAQPIRHLLAYKQVEYENKLYVCGPAPDFDTSSWFNEKFTLGFDFPNLPYLIDGEVKLTQSLAILRYLSRKYDLDGKTCEEKLRVDLVEQQLNDLKTSWGMLCYGGNFAEKRNAFEKSLPDSLRALSKFLGERPYFAGDRLTYVDFFAFEIFAPLLAFSKKSFSDFKNLTDFEDRLASLPTLKTYLESEELAKLPFNAPMAGCLTETS